MKTKCTTPTLKRLLCAFLSVVMACTLTFPVGKTSNAYASQQTDSNDSAEALGTTDDPIVGSLKIVARFNDSMAFYDGHSYLVFTSYQDGVTFPCTSDTNYAAYEVDDSYYTDIAADLGNGSWRTGTDADQYFTLMDKSSLPGSMTVNRGQVITIGNYRDFDMSIPEAALGAITNSTAWTSLSDSVKIAIVDKVLSLLSSQSTLSEEDLLGVLVEVTGSNDISSLKLLLDGEVNGGICYNRELYNQKLAWDQFENVTYSVDITQSQLDKLQSSMASYNKFSLLSNSCATVAVGLWNAALGEDSEYALSANGSGIFSFIQEPKYVRQSIESTLTGYKTNKLDSVEETDAQATTDGATYYVTAPSKVETTYAFAKSNALSIDTARTNLDVLRQAGLFEDAPVYPAGAVNYNVAIATKKTATDEGTQYAINSVTFKYNNKAISRLSSYDGSVWFTASADEDSVVKDANGVKLTSYYDADAKLIHFEVSSLPATVTIAEKGQIETSNLSLTSNGDQDVYYYNGSQKVAVTDESVLDEGETVYVKPTDMTDKVLESITLSTAEKTTSIKDNYDAEEGAYYFTMPGVNASVAIEYVAASVTEVDGHAVIQVEQGTSINLNDYFTIDTQSASKEQMTLKFADSELTPGIIELSEDGTLNALQEGKTSVTAYVNDDIFTVAVIEVYAGDMVSVTFNSVENGSYKIAAEHDGVATMCYYSGYLVKKNSTISVSIAPDEGYIVSGAYYGTGILKSLTTQKITGTFIADEDVQVAVSLEKAEVTDVPDTISLEAGGTYQLSPALSYASKSARVFNDELAYSSSDESIVKVSADGVITAVGNGVAAVTVKAVAGNGVAAVCTVTVGDVDGNEIVGRLTISARPVVEAQLVAHSFVSFTSYKDGMEIDEANYNRYYEYLQGYLDTINNAEEGVDGRLYNDSISQDVRKSYFDTHGNTSGTAAITLDKGDVITLSAYSTASSDEQAIMDAFMNGDIASYPSFQEMVKTYMTLQTDADKVKLFDSAFETLVQVFTDIYITGAGNPINGVTGGGITINKELYNQFIRSDSMTPNNTYTVEITANEFAHMKAYLENPSNNYYALLVHNCASVAAEVWNETLYDQQDLHVTYNYSLLGDEPESTYMSIGAMMDNANLSGYGIKDYVPGPLKNKQIEDLAGYSMLTIYGAENGTVTVTDALGNEYKCGDMVKKGTELTVTASCDPGYVLDSLQVNGEPLSGTTFTVKQDANLCVSIQKSIVQLDKTGLTMNVGDTNKIGVTVRHTADISEVGFNDVVFESNDPSVVSVDQYGNITALKSGVAEIVVSAKYGYGVSERCYIIVQDEESSKDIVGKLTIVGRYSTEALESDLDFGHGFFQFESNEDGLTVDISNMMWVYMPTDKYYEAVNTYDGEGIDPVTYHNESTDADELFTKYTDMSELGWTYTVNKGQIFTMGNSTNFISSAQCALEAILKGDIIDILKKHGKYAAINTLYQLVLTGDLSFSSFRASLIAALVEVGYDIGTGFNPFNGIVDDAALMINREIYRQAADHDQYPNTSYEVEITRDQLEILMMYMNEHSYYSVLDNNCSGVIANAWNVVMSGDADLQIDAGINGSLSSPKKLQSEITRIAQGKEGYSEDHNIFKAEKTNFIVYDDSKYVVKCGDQVVKPYDLVAEGTELSVYCIDDEGNIIDYMYVDSMDVNGTTVSGNTFTMGDLRIDLTCEAKTDSRHLVDDGVYTVRSVLGTRLDVAAGSTASGANVQVYTANKTAAQTFRFEWDASCRAYKITSLKSGKALDLNCAKAANGTNVQQYDSNDTLAQRWILESSEDGGFIIKSAVNEKYVLDVAAGSKKSGTNVQVYTANGTDAQRWNIKSAKYSETVEDGTVATLISGLSTDARSIALDISCASTANRANAQIYKTNGTLAQVFTFNYDEETGFYTIVNAASGKVLNLAAANASNGANVWQYYDDGTLACRWIVETNDDGYTIRSSIDPKLVLDVDSAKTANGTNVQVYRTNGTLAQKWLLDVKEA